MLQIWHLRATADRAPNLEIVFVRAMHSHVHSYVSWAACMLMLSCTIPAAPVIWKRHSWFANVVDTVPARRSTIVLRPPALGVIRQIVYRGIALGRRGVYGYSINTELRSQGATPRRTPRIGVFHTNVRNQDKDYAGYPQAHRASLRTVALTEYASRDMFLKIFEFFKGLF